MDQSVPGSPFAAIAEVARWSEGLALVLVAGPDYRAQEGLGLIGARLGLPENENPLWHRLDRDGPDLAGALRRAAAHRPVMLVHGLEYLNEAAREETEDRLNLLRDTLAVHQALIVLWVPSGELSRFRRRCVDLFHWRSLLVQLSAADVPMNPVDETRRRYLAWLSWSTAGAFDTEDRGKAYWPVPALVLPDGETAPRPFDDWAKQVDRGLLLGPAGSGKTTALWRLAHSLAIEGLQRGRDTPVPVLLGPLDRLMGSQWDDYPSALSSVAWGGADDVEVLLQAGVVPVLIVLLDAWGPDNATSFNWRPWRPGLSLVTTAEIGGAWPFLARDYTDLGWSCAELRPWDAMQQAAFLRGVGYKDLSAPLTRALLEVPKLPLIMATLMGEDWPQKNKRSTHELRGYDLIYRFISLRLIDPDHRLKEVQAEIVRDAMAADVLARSTEDAMRTVKGHLDEPRWHNTIVLTVTSLLLHGEDAALLQRWLWPPSDLPAPLALTRMTLVLEIAAEARLPREQVEIHLAEAQRQLAAAGEVASEVRRGLEEAIGRLRPPGPVGE